MAQKKGGCLKVVGIVFVILVIIGLFGGKGAKKAADSAVEETEEAATQVVSYDGATIEVPGAWRVADADDGKYVYPEYGGMVYLSTTDIAAIPSSVEEAYAEYIAGLTQGGQFTASDAVETIAIGEAVAFRTDIETQVDGTHLEGKLELILTEGKLYSVMFLIPDSAYDQYSEDIAAVLGSIELDAPSAPVFSSDSVEGDEDSQKEPEPTEEIDQTVIRPEFKEAMDSYEAFFDEYVEFMQLYQSDPTNAQLMLQLADMMSREAEMMNDFEAWEDADLTDAELAYYLEVQAHVYAKLAEVM